MDNKYLDYKDLECYKVAHELSNEVWSIVIKWDYFSKKTIGSQFVDAVDSISANIAEGFGRYGKKDKICFYRYSFGSLKESTSWAMKAFERNLLSKNEYASVLAKLEKLPLLLNKQIKYTRDKLAM